MFTLLVAIGVALSTGLAFADSPETEAELQVERQLGCPICTNLPLNVCDNQICEQMKGVIHDKLSQGETPDQVVSYFVSRYGEGVLLTPPQSGFSLAVWYLPVLGIIVGILVVWGFVRQSVRRQRQSAQRLLGRDDSLVLYRARVRQEAFRQPLIPIDPREDAET